MRLLVCVVCLWLSGCALIDALRSSPASATDAAVDGQPGDSEASDAPPDAGPPKDLISFSFLKSNNPALTASIVGTIQGTHVVVTVPNGTDISVLVATYQITGTRVTVNGIEQTSGVDAHNFGGPVEYVVFASDGSSKTYTVTAGIFKFTAAAALATGAGTTPQGVAIGDLNNDGKPDVVSANKDVDTISIFFNQTTIGAINPSFLPKSDLGTLASPMMVAIADFNADNKPDIAVANRNAGMVSVFLNKTTNGTFTASFTRFDFPSGTGSFYVASADFNGDTKPDLAVSNTVSDDISILLNTTTAGAMTPTFQTKVDLSPVGANADTIAIGDFNGDTKPDLAVAAESNASVLLNTITGGSTVVSFTAKADLAVGGTPVGIAAGNFDGNAHADLAVAVLTGVFFAKNNVTTPPTFDATIGQPVGTARAVAVADLNGDALDDVVTTQLSTNKKISVSINTTAAGSGSLEFAAFVDLTVDDNPTAVALGDLNADGKADIVVANVSVESLSVLLNQTTFPP